MDETKVSATPPDAKYEASDFHPATPVWLALGVALLTAAALLVVTWLFHWFETASDERVHVRSPLEERAAAEEPQPPPWPRKQLEMLREYESSALGTYDWVDKAKGIVRIPIDEAMKLILERESAPSGEKGGER